MEIQSSMLNEGQCRLRMPILNRLVERRFQIFFMAICIGTFFQQELYDFCMPPGCGVADCIHILPTTASYFWNEIDIDIITAQ